MKIILMQLGHRLDLRYAVNVGMDQPIGNQEVEGWGTQQKRDAQCPPVPARRMPAARLA